MQLPLQITSRNMSLSEAAEQTIREKAGKLDQFHDRITSCQVIVECPHRHNHQGVLYNVHVRISIPGKDIVVKREPDEDLYVAIRDAFDAARRQMQDQTHRQRGEVKAHEEAPHGVVSRIFPEESYGFISTPDGREIYFHRNSVKNDDFNKLVAATQVRFSEEEGEEGPHATVVMMAGS